VSTARLGSVRRALRRALRGALAATLVLVPLALAAPFDSRAEPPPLPSMGTADEDEAYALYRHDQYLSARTKAQAVLDKNPHSVVGHFVLGSVLREAEGSLPRAMAHLREAKRLYDLEPGPRDKGQVRLGIDLLWGLQSTAKLMEQFDVALRYLDELDRNYAPKVPAMHAWPLMKLHRYEEARAFARQGLASTSPAQKLTAMNALCAIAGEDHQRQGHYDACLRALDAARARGEGAELSVYAHNASISAMGLLRFDEAEKLALVGTHRLERSPSNPWRTLALLYTGEGRADDTVAALREMERWCAAQPPQYRDQKNAETFAVIASVLLSAGDATLGLHFIDRALDRPDRRAVTSSNPEQSLGGSALLRRALYRLAAEQDEERASARGPGARAAELASAVARRAQAWPDEERILAVLSDDERLVFTLRPYADGGLEPTPPWLAGDIVGVLGPGVAAVALARARAADADLAAMAPYFDAVEVEIALARGDHRRAADLAGTTLDRLPKAEALLRARTAALGAEAAARSGQTAASLVLFERALTIDPGVVRRLGLAIPARVESAGGADAVRAAALLRRSPRLTHAASGFVVRVEGDAQSLRACLLSPSASVLGCGTVTATAAETVDDLAVRLADEFHRAVFAMKFSLTPTDLRSLDGATTAAQGSAREALRGLFDAPVKDEGGGEEGH
jgi:tetratricopeptide (TPR) repeat protein